MQWIDTKRRTHVENEHILVETIKFLPAIGKPSWELRVAFKPFSVRIRFK